MDDEPEDEATATVLPTPEEARQELVLASDMLPTKLYIIPLEARPAFPGVILPMIFPPGPFAALLKRIVEGPTEKVVGLLMTGPETPPEDIQSLVGSMLKTGTAARILNFRETPEGPVQAIFQGIRRFEVFSLVSEGADLLATVTFPAAPKNGSDEVKALTMGIVNTLRELVKHNPVYSQEIKMFLSRGSLEDAGMLADFAVNMTTTGRSQLQDVLETVDLRPRLEKVLFLLRQEQDLNELKEKITKQIEEKITKQQREFFLREQLKAIKEELGLEKDDKTEEIEKFKKRLETLTLPDEAKTAVDEELGKLQVLSNQSPEYGVSRNYLDWLTSLPWGVHTEDKLDVAAARTILDQDHYGLKDVKERILEFIGVSKLRGSVEGSILCLMGPPGVGKTSIGKAVAECLGRKFFRFSLGGMRDEAEIKGHRRTYIGAMPGKVMQAIKTCGSQNPVIMLDEIDKVGASFQGDPASALLEVLDPEQNSSFRDHYLDVPFDLSKTLFIATANVPDSIPPALFDRMELINLSGYTSAEKLEIAKRHLIPRNLAKNGLDKLGLKFSEAGLKSLIENYAREAGVRGLEKALKACMRKIASRKAEGKQDAAFTVNAKNLRELLGPPKFAKDALARHPKPGVVTGLAWTALGGSTLFIESIAIPGKFGIKQTGQLGDVMRESVEIAFSYVSSRHSDFHIDRKFFDDHTIHLHVPAGATPKDGPSAGVTMATSLISLATNTKVRSKLAMTGELTLTGQVLPIGGVKEKLLAARRAGLTDVIFPEDNRNDLAEIPDEVKEGITPHFVTNYHQVYKLAFDKG